MSTAGRFKGCVAALAVVLMAAGALAQQTPYFTGDGGKGIRLVVLEPSGNGLSKDEQWILSLIQGSITGDFNNYSGMTIIDRQNLEKVLGEWKEHTSGKYSDADYIRIGNLTNASHMLTGNISKTASAFMVEFSVTDLQSGERKASCSPKPVSLLALENLSAVKKATYTLLRQLGVDLTDAALTELKQTEDMAKIQAETMLARGITAQRQGTEVAALSYFFQAAILDPSLAEAVNRSSVMAANISSGNIGADVRNDIAWRKAWVERLTEAEQFFNNFNKTESMPYTLYYSDDIKQGKVDYQTETVNLSIATTLIANDRWARPMERALQAVYDGLDATKRKGEWQLGNWPQRGVTNLNAFATRKQNFSVVFELLNNQNKIIGRQTLQTGGSWELGFNQNYRPTVQISVPEGKTLNFPNVNANDITDKMTIRVASVNGADAGIAAKNGVLQIKTFIKGITAGVALKDTRDGKSYRTVIVGSQTWMAENLNYQTGNSKCYGNDASNCAKYGRLYDWPTALKACPVGWHLPSDGEWSMLENVIGGSSTAGTKLKSKTGWSNNGNGTDDIGFSALSGGQGNYSGGSFSNAGSEGTWWSATESNANYPLYRRMYDYYGNVFGRDDVKTYQFSVRCVQD